MESIQINMKNSIGNKTKVTKKKVKLRKGRIAAVMISAVGIATVISLGTSVVNDFKFAQAYENATADQVQIIDDGTVTVNYDYQVNERNDLPGTTSTNVIYDQSEMAEKFYEGLKAKGITDRSSALLEFFNSTYDLEYEKRSTIDTILKLLKDKYSATDPIIASFPSNMHNFAFEYGCINETGEIDYQKFNETMKSIVVNNHETEERGRS